MPSLIVVMFIVRQCRRSPGARQQIIPLFLRMAKIFPRQGSIVVIVVVIVIVVIIIVIIIVILNPTVIILQIYFKQMNKNISRIKLFFIASNDFLPQISPILKPSGI